MAGGGYFVIILSDRLAVVEVTISQNWFKSVRRRGLTSTWAGSGSDKIRPAIVLCHAGKLILKKLRICYFSQWMLRH